MAISISFLHSFIRHFTLSLEDDRHLPSTEYYYINYYDCHMMTCSPSRKRSRNPPHEQPLEHSAQSPFLPSSLLYFSLLTHIQKTEPTIHSSSIKSQTRIEHSTVDRHTDKTRPSFRTSKKYLLIMKRAPVFIFMFTRIETKTKVSEVI